jgi:low affinity Fe/Cu permease
MGNMNHALISGDPKAGQNGNCVGFRGKFRFCAQWMAAAVGSPYAFSLATITILVWGITGPMFHYSDTWQLVINTATTIVTFLMVFLIQNTQNRDTKALHLKLDELLRGVGGARTSLVNLENLSDEELDRLQKEFERIKQRALHTKNKRHTDRERENSGEKNNSKSLDG